MTDRYDAEPPVRVIQAWRQGDWVMVALDGEVVWRRLTRDRAFTHAQVRFQSNRSPSVPKSRLAFHGVELRGEWRPLRSDGFWNNSDTVPIRESRAEAERIAPTPAGNHGLHPTVAPPAYEPAF